MKFNKKEIAKDTYYVGVNDRTKDKFENLIPLPYGVSYNSYLIVDEKVALIDSVDVAMGDLYIDKLESTLEGRDVDYLIINHIEPDHSGSIRFLRKFYPNMTIVGNKKTLDMLNGFYGIVENTLIAKEGETLQIGNHTLSFQLTPFVHWPETMMTYDTLTGTLFSGDGFGSFGNLDGGVVDTEIDTEKYWDEMYRYYANIVGKYGNHVQKALKKIDSLDIKMVCPTHGPVWTELFEKTLKIYNQVSRYEGKEGAVVIYSSMYGNTEQIAEAIADGLVQGGVKKVVLHNVTRTESSFILSDIFKYKGLVIGSTTYNNDIHPGVKNMMSKIENTGIKNREFGYFSSCSWANSTDKKLKEFSEKMKWNTVEEAIDEKMGLKDDNYQKAIALGKKLAENIKA